MKARREGASVLILPNSLQEKKKYPLRHLLPKKEAVVQIAYWKEHGNKPSTTKTYYCTGSLEEETDVKKSRWAIIKDRIKENDLKPHTEWEHQRWKCRYRDSLFSASELIAKAISIQRLLLKEQSGEDTEDWHLGFEKS